MDVDPESKKNKKQNAPLFDYEAEYKRLEQVKIQEELEEADGDHDKLHLWGRLRNEGVCKCGACDKRRHFTALRRVGKNEEQLAIMHEKDEFIQSCFKCSPSDFEYVEEMLEKYGRELLEYSGGPIAVSNCEVCQGRPSKDMCYHCGKQPWMRSRQDLKTARRDMKQYTRYHITTPIHAAAMASNFEMVEKLISFGASVNHKDSTGCTALHWVACSGHLSATKTENCVRIAQRLLKDGVDVTVEDDNNKTAIELTGKPNPVFNAMRMAILKSARKKLTTQLLDACKDCDTETVNRVLKAGANLATGDYLNDTPFHILAMYGHMDLLLELIEQADKEERLLELLDAQTVDGLTPADTAIKWGYKALHSKLVSIANNKRMVQVVEQLAKGDKVPVELRGTALGIQLEREIRKHNAPGARLRRALHMKEKKQTVANEGGDQNKSAVCVVS